jgi:hypothetical protein
MRTPGPATGLPFAFPQFFNHTVYMFYPRFQLFDNGNPANPLITLNWRKIIPLHKRIGIGCQSYLHITWNFMQNAIVNIASHFLFLGLSFVQVSAVNVVV